MTYYTKRQIEDILLEIEERIDISDKLFEDANNEYKALGRWIDKKTDEDGSNYIVNIYPQGSFALGTVVKPISDEDDYDLDLVCEILNGDSLTPDQLKNHVSKAWLTSYRRSSTEIEEKRRCWHVEYDEVPNFHMDVIPAITPNAGTGSLIKITDKNEVNCTYRYMQSNPAGYIEWFLKQCNKRVTDLQGSKIVHEMAMQEPVKKYRNKKILQKAIQLMKRHRDIMFEEDSDNKPISIIITTLSAQIYNGEQSVYDTICNFMNKVETYLAETKKNGRYYIANPSYPTENFADKWQIHPIRQRNFFNWIQQLKEDFNLQNLMNKNRVDMGKHIKKIFGTKTAAYVFAARGKQEVSKILENKLRIDTKTGSLSGAGTVIVPPNRHHGKV